LTTTSQIDTLNGDIDEFVPTYANVLRRWFLDNRTNGITLLKQKYLDLKELLELIIETQKHSEQLFAIKIAIEESTIGLTALKNNPRYQNDAIMRASLDFLLDNQIPTLINMAREDPEKNACIGRDQRSLKVKELREKMMVSARDRINQIETPNPNDGKSSLT
jgi:hypothetical protein